MRTQPHPSATAPQPLWSTRIWPPLAGTVAAVGVFAASNAFGVFALLVVYATLSMFAVATVWWLSLEIGIGIEPPSVVRWSLYAALVAVAAAGLCQVHPRYGPLTVVAVGLSSPTVLTLIVEARPRITMRRTDRAVRPAAGVLVDKALLERRFDEIVSQLRESGDFPKN